MWRAPLHIVKKEKDFSKKLAAEKGESADPSGEDQGFWGKFGK